MGIFPIALSIHHVRKGSTVVACQREVHTLKMKLQEIMKGTIVFIVFPYVC